MLKKSRCDVKVQVIGVRRGGKTTKIHTIVDALGNSLRFMLTRGHVHDSKVATDMLGAINLNGVNSTLKVIVEVIRSHLKVISFRNGIVIITYIVNDI